MFMLSDLEETEMLIMLPIQIAVQLFLEFKCIGGFVGRLSWGFVGGTLSFIVPF